MDNMTLWSIAFAALTDQIDSLSKKANDNNAHQSHKKSNQALAELFDDKCSEFLDTKQLSALLKGTTGNQTDASLLQLLSVARGFIDGRTPSPNDEKTGERFDVAQKLSNVISRLNIFRGQAKPRTFEIAPLEAKIIFPDSTEKKSWPDMIESLQDDLDAAFHEANAQRDPARLFRSVARVLERYTWCLPVAGQADNLADISFFDHNSLTSAVAASLYQWHADMGNLHCDAIASDEKPRLLLIAGDFSGIQNYIMSKTHQRQRGMAKKLRARSFIVSCMLDLALEAILLHCSLPSSCTLMNSGGNFYVLAPNTPQVLSILDQLSQNIDQELLRKFHGDVALHLAHVPLCGSDLASFSKKIDQVKQKLFYMKKAPFMQLMQAGGEWQALQVVDRPASSAGRQLCTGCGREFADRLDEDGEPIGPKCRLEMRIGKELTRAKSLTLKRDVSGPIALAGLSIALDGSDGEVFMFRSDASPFHKPVKRIATHIPLKKERDVLSAVLFEEIAASSRGAAWLGYLKADVDWMGKLFAIGFMGDNGEDDSSIARIASLSRLVEMFFSEWMDQYVAKHFSDCYTVFSGGDDLFMIGPWNRIVKLAVDLHEQFTRFSGSNPNLTISASVSLAHSGKPVAYMSEVAEDALDNAKNAKLPDEAEGRDQLCIFGHVMKWRDAKTVFSDAEQVVKWMQSRQANGTRVLSVGDVQRLHAFSLLFERYRLDGDIRGLRYVGLLMYDIGKKSKERTDQLVIQYLESLRDISKNGSINHLRVVCEYALLYNRGRSDERGRIQ